MTVVEVPGSKSVTNRALFLAAAAHGTTRLRKPLDSDDTAGFAEGLAALGYRVTRTPSAWAIEGRPQGPAFDEASVFCRDGATTAHFLPALAAAGHGIPPEQAAKIAVHAIRSTSTLVSQVRLVAFDQTTHDLLQTALSL